MSRKKYTRVENPLDTDLKFREKRKWQINLRRYVLEQQSCPAYAPYFGLDKKSMRQWFQYQFKEDMSWESFGKKWQFDHIIPVVYFDFSVEKELFLCWNFTNLRVEAIKSNKERGHRVDVLMSKKYFEDLYNETGYRICKDLLEKIDQLALSEILSTSQQQHFIKEHIDYLEQIKNYSFFEFEMLNSGRSVEDVRKEIAVLESITTRKQ